MSGHEERLRRWRLILGEAAGFPLPAVDIGMDSALQALYDAPERSANLGPSAPNVARWLGDIRKYFPAGVVRVIQADAMERLNLRQMLLEPETLDALEPDVNLAATLISLKNVIPARTRETARLVVRKVCDELERRLANKMRQAVMGSLNRAARNRRPRHSELDWHRTIRANLRHYQPAYRTIIPVTRIGHGRKRSSLKEIILCVDQSGSMAASVVYSSIFAAVLATLQAVRTNFVVFDTNVVDLTDQLADPVDVLFGTQLGGGTNINQALAYCQTLIRAPDATIVVLISDLYEGGFTEEMMRRAATITQSGATMVALLALSDSGAPGYHHKNAAALASLEIPAFACTPDAFPELMATAIQRQDIGQWAAREGLVTSRPDAELAQLSV